MTLQEFKSWFDGFTENMSETPTKKQWARIQARVKEIDGATITYPIFIDRYWPHLAPHPYIHLWHGVAIYNGNTNVMDDGHYVTTFNSAQAMYALGAVDADVTRS